MIPKLQPGDALLVVDPQNDFIPGGSLAVAEGDQVIPILNNWIAAAQAAGIPIIISRDWHPANHVSFKEQGGPWPVHCVQNTQGADFHQSLRIPENAIIVNKAFEVNKEAYSAFEGLTALENKKLAEKLEELGVKRVWIGGLALDYCVYRTAIGAHENNFSFHIILPACRAIAEDTEQQALSDLENRKGIFETDANPYFV